LFLTEGDQWHRQRRMLAPVFTPASIGTLLPHFVQAATSLVSRLDGKAQANLSLTFQEAALEAVLGALFSLPGSGRFARIPTIVPAYFSGAGRPRILDGFAPTEDSFSFATRKRRRFYQAWSAAVDEVIAARRQCPPTAGRRDMLDLLFVARDPDSG